MINIYVDQVLILRNIAQETLEVILPLSKGQCSDSRIDVATLNTHTREPEVILRILNFVLERLTNPSWGTDRPMRIGSNFFENLELYQAATAMGLEDANEMRDIKAYLKKRMRSPLSFEEMDAVMAHSSTEGELLQGLAGYLDTECARKCGYYARDEKFKTWLLSRPLLLNRMEVAGQKNISDICHDCGELVMQARKRGFEDVRMRVQ
jgi:hypothetical protein